MKRRTLLTSSLAALALASSPRSLLGGQTEAPAASDKREYYLLRRYQMNWGPQVKAAHEFLRQALVPAANRLGIAPVGVFNVIIGPYTPRVFVLLPSTSLETLCNLDEKLRQDSEYQRAGAPFLDAPAAQPAYLRVETILLRAFEGWPRLVLPPATGKKEPRLFELRTYQDPTDRDHVRKLEMMNTGYFPIFKEAGFAQVFYGDTLAGPTMPDLTYMLSFKDLAERDKNWKAYFASEAWKKLSTNPRYTFEGIVSRVSNQILSPTDYSQI